MNNDFNYNYNYNNTPNNLDNSPNNRIYAVASLVCGILSILCCCLDWIAAVIGVGAIVLFALDRYFNKKSDGLAIAGLVCGIVGIILIALAYVVALALVDYMQSPEFQSIMNEAGVDISDIGRF